MSILIDGPTVIKFVEDEETFKKCVEEQFSTLDVNGDGVLSRSELLKGFEGIGDVFEKFDTDQSGTVDLAEFTTQMKEIMLAVAQGIGESPVQVALESNDLLMKAVEHHQPSKQE